jgi:phage-related protein
MKCANCCFMFLHNGQPHCSRCNLAVTFDTVCHLWQKRNRKKPKKTVNIKTKQYKD